jgi:hypothetical protein
VSWASCTAVRNRSDASAHDLTSGRAGPTPLGPKMMAPWHEMTYLQAAGRPSGKHLVDVGKKKQVAKMMAMGLAQRHV